MNRSRKYQIAAFAVPALCIGIAVGLTAYESRRYQRLDNELRATEQEIRAARLLIAEVEGRGKAGYIATVPDSSQEQVTFVGDLRATAAACGVRLTQWAAAPALPIPPPAGATPEAIATLAKVTPITAQIGVSGSYEHTRAFLHGLEIQERLVTLTGVRWVRSDTPPATALTFILTRYVGAMNSVAMSLPPGR